MIIDDHIGDIKTRLISSGPHRVRADRGHPGRERSRRRRRWRGFASI